VLVWRYAVAAPVATAIAPERKRAKLDLPPVSRKPGQVHLARSSASRLPIAHRDNFDLAAGVETGCLIRLSRGTLDDLPEFVANLTWSSSAASMRRGAGDEFSGRRRWFIKAGGGGGRSTQPAPLGRVPAGCLWRFDPERLSQSGIGGSFDGRAYW
jgi:hypothetical protein